MVEYIISGLLGVLIGVAQLILLSKFLTSATAGKFVGVVIYIIAKFFVYAAVISVTLLFFEKLIAPIGLGFAFGMIAASFAVFIIKSKKQ